MNGLEPLIPITFFLSLAGVIVLRGPLGRALADRIAGRNLQRDGELDQLQEEMVDLRERLAEAEERIEFSERLLTRHAPDTTPGSKA